MTLDHRETAPLPLDNARQVEEVPAGGGRIRFRLTMLDRYIAGYDPRDGELVKAVYPERHAFRKSPGIAWNLEVLALADRRGAKRMRVTVRGSNPEHLVIPWEVVRRYAWLAIDGDPRYLVEADVDRQALIPWEVLRGEADRPPIDPRVLDGRAWRKSPEHYRQEGPTLFDPPDDDEENP